MNWLASLTFWLTLLGAALTYAAVALSPKFLVFHGLRSQYADTQVRLVGLEQQVSHLQKVVDALENDPAFQAEVARTDLGASRPGEEQIAVDERLTLNTRVDCAAVSPTAQPVWYAGIVSKLATDFRWRTGLLVATIVTTLYAFTFLQASRPLPRGVRWSVLRSAVDRLKARYRVAR